MKTGVSKNSVEKDAEKKVERRGRKKKYATEEEKKAALREQKREWRRRNTEKVSYNRRKSFARKFIELGNQEDLDMLEQWLEQRKEELEKK